MKSKRNEVKFWRSEVCTSTAQMGIITTRRWEIKLEGSQNFRTCIAKIYCQFGRISIRFLRTSILRYICKTPINLLNSVGLNLWAKIVQWELPYCSKCRITIVFSISLVIFVSRCPRIFCLISKLLEMKKLSFSVRFSLLA